MWTEDEDDRPTTLTEWEDTDTAHIDGSHTIMDIFDIAATLDESDPGAAVAVTDTEALAAFGTTTPTITDLARVGGPHDTTMRKLLRGRSEARHLTIYKNHTPHQLLFWGYSGD